MVWLKRLLITLLVLVFIAVLAVMLIPTRKITDLVSKKISEQTGRALVFEGDPSRTIFPVLGLSLDRVTLSNAEWGKNPYLLDAKGAAVGVDLMSLLMGEIEVTELILNTPKLYLERNENGVGNWEFAPKEQDEASTDTSENNISSSKDISFTTLNLNNAQVIYNDHGDGRNIQLTDFTAQIDSLNEGREFALTSSGAYNGEPFSAITTLADAGKGTPWDHIEMSLNLAIAGAHADINGIVATSFAPADALAKADISVKIPSLTALTEALGQAPIEDRGIAPFTLSAALTVDNASQFNLQKVDIGIAENNISGNFDVNLEGIPAIHGTAEIGNFDLKEFLSGESSLAWSKTPINLPKLDFMIADVDFNANSIDLGTVKFGNTDGNITLENGIATFDLNRSQIFDGIVRAKVTLNPTPLQLQASFVANDMAIGTAIKGFTGHDFIEASGDMQASIASQGQSVHALMNALNGTGNISLIDGKIVGIDIMKTIEALNIGDNASQGETRFTSLLASFNIESGVLKNNDLALDSKVLQASGKGMIGLGAQTVNYRVTPQLLDMGLVSVPITIKGPWSSVSFKPDMEALAKGIAEQHLGAELKALEIEKQKLEEQAKEVLGNDLSQDAIKQNVEQKAKEAIEEKLKEEVGGLLNGLFN